MFLALFITGLILGSFLDAATWRMHAGEDWVHGRSHCDHCGHSLAARDLIPIFSWLTTLGRCRYCNKRVSWQHPVIELTTAAVFSLSYLWWPGDLSLTGQKLLLAGWLLSSIGLIALAVYDLNWMLLPNKIIYPTLVVAAASRLIYLIAYEPRPWHAAGLWLASILVASGFFWLLFVVSRGRWIGYGDVRLGLITGTLLVTPARSFLMIFLASVIGSLVAIPLLAAAGKSLKTRLPFGPFLITATFTVGLFGQAILDWYNRTLLK